VVLRRVRSRIPLAADVARWLLVREVRALEHLDGLDGFPRVLSSGPGWSIRTLVPGTPLHRAPPRDPGFYAAALRLIGAMHRAGVVHDDLHKEANWIVRTDGRPALVDLQLATIFRRRGPLFRLLAREDVRHLLKHKRKYCREALSDRQTRILRTPSLPSRVLRGAVKKPYHLLTRRLLGWTDTEGWRHETASGETRADSTRPGGTR
jgi:RIO-like serine/threonine protein kinase